MVLDQKSGDHQSHYSLGTFNICFIAVPPRIVAIFLSGPKQWTNQPTTTLHCHPESHGASVTKRNHISIVLLCSVIQKKQASMVLTYKLSIQVF